MIKVMKKRGFAAMLVVAIIAIVLVAVGGVWYYRAHQALQINAAPTNSTATQTQATSSASISNSSSSDQSASSTIFITPTSGPAGTMVIVHNFPSCTDADMCMGHRFDVPLFVQSGIDIPQINNSNLSESTLNGSMAYQVPASSTPGDYEFVIQNCLGKGCGNEVLGRFTVIPQNSSVIPHIDSISPRAVTSSTLPGIIITVHGSNFTSSTNYISFVGNKFITASGTIPDTYSYIAEVGSPDGKTLVFQLPTSSCSFNSCFYTQDGTYKVAVSNAKGTSNYAWLAASGTAAGPTDSDSDANLLNIIISQPTQEDANWGIGQTVPIQWKAPIYYSEGPSGKTFFKSNEFSIMLVSADVIAHTVAQNQNNDFTITSGPASNFMTSAGDMYGQFLYNYMLPNNLNPGKYSLYISQDFGSPDIGGTQASQDVTIFYPDPLPSEPQ
jgi:hypothetical protein